MCIHLSVYLYFTFCQGTNILELRVKRMYYKSNVCSFNMLCCSIKFNAVKHEQM